MKKNLFIIFAILIIPVLLYGMVNLFNSNTNAVQASSDKPTVIDFSSPMCFECKQLEKVMTPVMPKYKDKINFRKVNVNLTDAETQRLIKKYNVTVVPTLTFLDKEGKIVNRTEGSMPQAQLESNLNKLLN